MDEIVVKVSNLSKAYKLYDKPVDRLKESLHPLRKKYHKDFYAINDVSFEINKGETVGIIGKNGSGKSTLLKIISGILTPTTGEVYVKGNVSALLELGTGFNLEFTGMENIYLNGTIMGLSKEEINNRVEDILSFADIGDFINQPVKTYSSGMFVRLAFSVQAIGSPNILIVDEALAVGDTAFTFKCINHMKKLVDQGTTILLVTHDVATVRSFCTRAIWVDNGKNIMDGNARAVTSEYLKFLFDSEHDTNNTEEKQVSNKLKSKQNHENNNLFQPNDYECFRIPKKCDRWGSGNIIIKYFTVLDDNDNSIKVLKWGSVYKIKVIAKALKDIECKNVGFGFSFRNKNGLDIIVSTTIEEGYKLGPYIANDYIEVTFKFENILSPGDYLITLQVEDRTEINPKYFDFIENACIIKVISEKEFHSLVQPKVEQKVKKMREGDSNNI